MSSTAEEHRADAAAYRNLAQKEMKWNGRSDRAGRYQEMARESERSAKVAESGNG